MGMNPEFIRFLVTVRLRRGVDDDRLLRGDAFEPVIDEGGDMDEDRVVDPGAELIDLAAGRGTLTAVVQDDLHHPLNDRHVVGLSFVIVPPLDHPRIAKMSRAIRKRVRKIQSGWFPQWPKAPKQPQSKSIPRAHA